MRGEGKNRREGSLGGNQSIFDAFEAGVFRLLFDIVLCKEGLLALDKRVQGNRFCGCFCKSNPLAAIGELLSFDDEYGGALGEGKGG